eukprot:TRINITY_DN14050_c0_g1_i1.p1 TRINITY_DN14050_c0_g1~~TRINITY_DN14050_c0_g1_i1.p1  ORF type:complete len:235 (+),score=22.98 TRINITY_DN14050_c0_g1_i1:74-778(+)
MALTLFGVPASQPVRAVMWALAHSGTPYQFKFTLPGRHTSRPEFAAVSPYSYVPRIQEGEGENAFVLNEAGAIMAYLGQKHNWSLYPSDLQKRARVDEYMHWHHRGTREITHALFAPAIRVGEFRPEQIAVAKMSARNALAKIESQILHEDRGGWMAGDQPTVADLMACTEISQCEDEFLGLLDFEPYPRIRRWLGECKKLPGFNEAHEPLEKVLPTLRGMIQKYYGDGRPTLD